MNNDLSILHLIAEASLVVQIVMALLLIASIISWTFIFSKRKQLKQAVKVMDAFEHQFKNSGDLESLYYQLSNKGHDTLLGVEIIFVAGYQEFLKMYELPQTTGQEKIESAQKAMRISLTRELDSLDESLPFLATVGSTSPYIGLFGTVWGIMNSFRSLSGAKQATLAQVAPGIAEALVATAIGLFAAIPAVMAYNRFSTSIDRLGSRYELFVDEFGVLLQYQVR